VTLVKILSLLFVALIAGGWMMGSVLVISAQKKLTASEYTAVEQANTSYGKRYFPVVAGVSIILLGILVYLSRESKGQMALIACSLLLIVAAVGFTRAKMVPLNDKIETWSVQAPPSDWQESRDLWHRNHRIRTGLAVTAFVLLSVAIVQGAPKSTKASVTSNRAASRTSSLG
jgi:uncharacterized membrane protein